LFSWWHKRTFKFLILQKENKEQGEKIETSIARAEMPSAFFSGDICAQMSVITRNPYFSATRQRGVS